FGTDPNWGRIAAAMGQKAAERGWRFDPAKISVRLQGVVVYHRAPVSFDTDALRALLRGEEVFIDVDVGEGSASATSWGCDLSYDYVRINADYGAVLVDTPGGPVRRDTNLDNKTPELKAEALLQALRYIERFSGTRAVIKYGGAAMVQADLKDRFA